MVLVRIEENRTLDLLIWYCNDRGKYHFRWMDTDDYSIPMRVFVSWILDILATFHSDVVFVLSI